MSKGIATYTPQCGRCVQLAAEVERLRAVNAELLEQCKVYLQMLEVFHANDAWANPVQDAIAHAEAHS